jgi:hydrogenase maturation factor
VKLGNSYRETSGMKVSNKKVFFLYAHPCGDVLVKRGSLPAETLEGIRQDLRSGGDVKADPKLFKVAYAILTMIAKRVGKRTIDEEVMHEYYWKEHDEHVMNESKIKEDVIPEMCKVFPGRILYARGKGAVVETPVGRRSINIEFVPNISVGDCVTVHYNYACERIDESLFRGLWREKNGR